MAIEGINVNMPSVAAMVSNSQIESQKDVNESDAADEAKKKLDKKIAIKKDTLKNTGTQRETFQRSNKTQQQMNQILGGAAGPEAADGLSAWQGNKDIQSKLSSAQKEMFKEAMAKNPSKGGKAGKAMDNLAKQPGFGKAVKGSQQMGNLQKAMLDNPKQEGLAKQIINNPAMQSAKTDGQVKKGFMDFGLRQGGKGKMESVKQAGDLLGTMNKGKIGRSGQRATMNMANRTGGDSKAMSNMDAFVKNPNVSKLPMGARTKGTELLAKADGKGEVKEGLEKLASDPKLQGQCAQNKGRFFSTVGTGRPSEYRQITDSLLTSLQSPGMPKRDAQVGKFLNKVSQQVQKGGAKGIDTKGAMKTAKSSPMPKLSLLSMDDDMDPEMMQKARAQNRASVMAYAQKLGRMYEKAEKGLGSAKYLEDVNKLKGSRPPEAIDLSSLPPEEQEFVTSRLVGLKTRHASLKQLEKKMSRLLRTKRRKRGKTGEARARNRQPRYFSPNAARGVKATEAFAQATGTGDAQGLPQTPQRGQMLNRAAGQMGRGGMQMGDGGSIDIQGQVASALQGLGDGPLTAEVAGQVAQTIASSIATQIGQQIAQQISAQLSGGVVDSQVADFSAQMSNVELHAQGEPAAAPQNIQQGKVDGWGIPRSFERDLGGASQAPVKAPEEEIGQTFDEAVAEKYTGRMLIKDPTSIRGLGELFEAGWADLSKPESALLKNLGWSRQMWDAKNSPSARWPGAMSTSFVGLNPVQREAVRKLGFTPHDWDKKVQAFSSGKNA